MSKLYLRPDKNCKYCHGDGDGEVFDAVDYGSTVAYLPSLCDCVTEQVTEGREDDEIVINTREALPPYLAELAAVIVGGTNEIMIEGSDPERRMYLYCSWTPEHGFEIQSEIATLAKEYPATRFDPAEQLWRYENGKSYTGHSIRGLVTVAEYDGFNIKKWEKVQ